MSSSRWSSPLLRFAFLGAAVLLAVGTASAQFASTPDSSHSAAAPATESSSNDFVVTDSGSGDGSEPSAPEPAGHAAGQYDNAAGGGSHGLRSRMAFETGSGFSGPTSDSSPYITWGGNLTVGAGLHFTKRITVLAEYQFIDDKLPGKIIAETGATGGNAHIWSLTLDPVIDLFPKSHNDVYVTGGGGFYRKVTNFTDPQPTLYCDYYYCGITYQNAVVGHFSSNQGGWNVGAGYAHRFGGMYGDSKMQVFAEARYLDVLTPEVNSSPNGLGTTFIGKDTKIVPVTFGVRF
jgi:hypothetical protein